jgi:cbb3-type cytochrome oxidase cytochrome c subunit
VPLPLELALRQMKASRSCWKCHSKKVFIVMPEQYAAMKAEKGV